MKTLSLFTLILGLVLAACEPTVTWTMSEPNPYPSIYPDPCLTIDYSELREACEADSIESTRALEPVEPAMCYDDGIDGYLVYCWYELNGQGHLRGVVGGDKDAKKATPNISMIQKKKVTIENRPLVIMNIDPFRGVITSYDASYPDVLHTVFHGSFWKLDYLHFRTADSNYRPDIDLVCSA